MRPRLTFIKILFNVMVFVMFLSIHAVSGGMVYEVEGTAATGPSVRYSPETYDVYMPEQPFHVSEALYCTDPAYYHDTYVIHVSKRTGVSIEVEDCCLLDETICIGAGFLGTGSEPGAVSGKRCAESPDEVWESVDLEPGVYSLYVWYQDCVGSGSGYDIWITSTNYLTSWQP